MHAAFIHALKQCASHWNYRMHVSLLLLFAPRNSFHHTKTHTLTQSSECDLDTEFLCDSISMINRPLFVFLCVCVCFAFSLCHFSIFGLLQAKMPWHAIILFASYEQTSSTRQRREQERDNANDDKKTNKKICAGQKKGIRMYLHTGY